MGANIVRPVAGPVVSTNCRPFVGSITNLESVVVDVDAVPFIRPVRTLILSITPLLVPHTSSTQLTLILASLTLTH